MLQRATWEPEWNKTFEKLTPSEATLDKAERTKAQNVGLHKLSGLLVSLASLVESLPGRGGASVMHSIHNPQLAPLEILGVDWTNPADQGVGFEGADSVPLLGGLLWSPTAIQSCSPWQKPWGG